MKVSESLRIANDELLCFTAEIIKGFLGQNKAPVKQTVGFLWWLAVPLPLGPPPSSLLLLLLLLLMSILFCLIYVFKFLNMSKRKQTPEILLDGKLMMSQVGANGRTVNKVAKSRKSEQVTVDEATVPWSPGRWGLSSAGAEEKFPQACCPITEGSPPPKVMWFK